MKHFFAAYFYLKNGEEHYNITSTLHKFMRGGDAKFDACHKLGMSECNVHLAQLVIYLSNAKKSIVAYMAYGKVKKDIEEYGNFPVSMHIRNAPTKLMEKLGYGKGYKYTPMEDSSSQEYLPSELKDKKYI